MLFHEISLNNAGMLFTGKTVLHLAQTKPCPLNCIPKQKVSNGSQRSARSE